MKQYNAIEDFVYYPINKNMLASMNFFTLSSTKMNLDICCERSFICKDKQGVIQAVVIMTSNSVQNEFGNIPPEDINLMDDDYEVGDENWIKEQFEAIANQYEMIYAYRRTGSPLYALSSTYLKAVYNGPTISVWAKGNAEIDNEFKEKYLTKYNDLFLYDVSLITD